MIFAVKGWANLLQSSWRTEAFKYMTGIISAKNQKSIIVNGVSDHVHIFIGLKPSILISDVVRDVKNNSSNFINDQKYLPGNFSWQEGYGVFSYGHSQIDAVYKYILNQEVHHKKKTFRAEYLDFLTKFGIEFKDHYLFDWIE
jgi:putative transposase